MLVGVKNRTVVVGTLKVVIIVEVRCFVHSGVNSKARLLREDFERKDLNASAIRRATRPATFLDL